MALVPSLTSEIRRLQPGIRVSEATPQTAIVDAQTVRERLLSVLALFFAVVAILLAAVGLYGVLDYAVLQRRRDIGIRLAIGARPFHVAWSVLAPHLAMVVLGIGAGLGLGLYAARWVDALLYQTKSTEPALLVLPWTVVALSSAAAALPALRRALRLDPLTILRAE